MSATRTIGITLGDINGIGPEVALKAACSARWPPNIRIVLVGSRTSIEDQARTFRVRLPRALEFWDPLPSMRLAWNPGRIDARASAAAGQWIRAAAAGCLDGTLDGMVTAPISKEGFLKAGLRVPGHTEFLAALTKTKRYGMMLFGGGLRVMLATRHIPIRSVPRALTRANVLEAIDLAARALPWMGIRRARVAVCGLNPHAGEGGAIGSEEKTVIAPAIARARRAGHNVTGPHPADTVFHHAAKGRYDAVVAMYHDQGLAPLKLLAFDSGVNVTLGLPIVRTSPDHGTAFDIAGRGVADASSMIEAVRWAARLSAGRNPWRVR